MRYEKFITAIYGDTWKETTESKDGGYSIAMVIAFIKGALPNLKELSAVLNVQDKELAPAFNRLITSGIFSPKFNAKADPELLGKGFSIKPDCRVSEWKEEHAYASAWANIAAIGSGLIIRNY